MSLRKSKSGGGSAAAATAIQSATIFKTGQTFDGGGFANAFAFTSSDAQSGSTTAMLGTANKFTAQHTGPHLLNMFSVSTSFAGSEWGQLAYKINSGSQSVFTYGDNKNAAGGARVVPSGSVVVQLTSGDTVQFYSNTNSTTNWAEYTISFTDLTPR